MEIDRPWMPVWVGDTLLRTQHLSPSQHGAYTWLVYSYWQNKGLPTDERKLARLARMSREEWDHDRNEIATMFEPGWKLPWLDKEIERALTKFENRSAGRKKLHEAGNVIGFKP